MSKGCKFVSTLLKAAESAQATQGTWINPATGGAAGFVLGLLLNSDANMKRSEWLKSQLLYTLGGAGAGALLERRNPVTPAAPSAEEEVKSAQ